MPGPLPEEHPGAGEDGDRYITVDRYSWIVDRPTTHNPRPTFLARRLNAENLGTDEFHQRAESAVVLRGAQPQVRPRGRRRQVRRQQYARVPGDEPQRP